MVFSPLEKIETFGRSGNHDTAPLSPSLPLCALARCHEKHPCYGCSPNVRRDSFHFHFPFGVVFGQSSPKPRVAPVRCATTVTALPLDRYAFLSLFGFKPFYGERLYAIRRRGLSILVQHLEKRPLFKIRCDGLPGKLPGPTKV